MTKADALAAMHREAGYDCTVDDGRIIFARYQEDGDRLAGQVKDWYFDEIPDAGTAGADDLVLCESPDGWSLHAPGSSDDEIASGDATYLVCGEGEPTAADYVAALRVLVERSAAR